MGEEGRCGIPQDVEKLDQPGTSNYLDQASAFVYTPSRKLQSVTKTGVEKGDNEAYVYDAAGNVTSQTIGATTSTMTYDRNRLVKTVSGATTLNHRYDSFGRSTTTDAGSQVVEQNAYDGYDRVVRQQKFDSAGTALFTKVQAFDPFDRVTSQAEKVGTAQSITTRFTFVGLADQIAAEERKDTTGAFKVTKSYAYGAAGENLSLTDTPVNTTTSKKSFYGTNPHSDRLQYPLGQLLQQPTLIRQLQPRRPGPVPPTARPNARPGHPARTRPSARQCAPRQTSSRSSDLLPRLGVTPNFLQSQIAVGADANGMLVAASNTSSSFTRGQRSLMDELGILRAPSRTVSGDKLHAEENLLGVMPSPTGIGTSALEPCAGRCYPLLSRLGIPWATTP